MDRRSFLGKSLGGAIAAALLPSVLKKLPPQLPEALPEPEALFLSDYGRVTKSYVANECLYPGDFVYINNMARAAAAARRDSDIIGVATGYAKPGDNVWVTLGT